MSKELVSTRQELVVAEQVLEGEILGEDCELGFSRCTNSDLETMRDEYRAELDGEHVIITACLNCAQDNSDAI